MAKPALEITKNKIMHFDQAMTLTGFGRFNLFVLLATGGALMCVIMETMGMMYVIPAAECDLQLSLTMKGYISAASFLGVVSGSHLWGFFADTRGRKRIILINLIVSFIMTLISSVVPEDWVFALLRFFNGLFISGAASVVYAHAGEFHDDNYRPKVISWVSTFVAFGIMVLPALAWLILPGQWSFELSYIGITFRPWRLLVVAYGLPSVIFAICIACIPESPKFLLTQGKDGQALDILKKMYSSNSRKAPEEFPVSKVLWDEDVNNYKNERFFKCMWKQTIPLFKRPFLLKTFMVCALQFGVFMTTSGLAMWYPEIFNRLAAYERENPEEEVTLCNAINYHIQNEELLSNNTPGSNDDQHCNDTIESEVFTIGILTGSFLALTYIAVGGLINILGKKNLLIGFFTISSAAGLIAQYMYGAEMLKILMSLVSISSTTIGVVNAVAVDLYPTQVRAMALAISLMVGRIGAVTGSHITGMIFYQICDYTFYVVTGVNLVLIVLVLLLPTSPRTPKMIETIT